MKRSKIICKYLKTWFVIDLLASFPYTWFIQQQIYDSVDIDGSIDPDVEISEDSFFEETE